MTDAPRQSAVRTALAGLIGNVLEWFDFAVYGYFAADIGRQFFPATDPTASKLTAYLVMLLGFLARPAGSIVLGLVGDRIGRRALLTISISLMGGATLIMGCLPTYDSIGVAAPILLVLCRLAQGFSLGGEFTGSMVYTTELASPLARGLISSSTAAGTTLGFILGSGSVLLVNLGLGEAAAADWGWRIPFIASIVFCLAGFWLRDGIHESTQGEKAVSERLPWFRSLIGDWKPTLLTFGIVGMTNAAYYMVFQFAVDARKAGANAAATNFQLVNTIALFVVLFSKPLGGWLSDRVGRRRLMITLQLAGMAAIYPTVSLMMYGSPLQFMLGQFLIAVPLGMALGLQGAMLVELFPLRTRVTSMSIAYSVALALSGGVAPYVSTYLLDVFHDPMVLVYFVLAHGVIGLAMMWPMAETNGRSLD